MPWKPFGPPDRGCQGDKTKGMIVGTSFLPQKERESVREGKRERERERNSLSLVKLEIDTGSCDSIKTGLFGYTEVMVP